MSQVSRALARIEKTCGARLIHRSTHALSLTPGGVTFLAHCQRIGETVDDLAGEFAEQACEGIDIALRTGSALPDTAVARSLGHLGRALYATPGYLADVGTPAHPNDLRLHRLVTNRAAP